MAHTHSKTKHKFKKLTIEKLPKSGTKKTKFDHIALLTD